MNSVFNETTNELSTDLFEQVSKELKLTKEQIKDKDVFQFVKNVGLRKQSGDWYQYWNGNGYCELNKVNGTMITTVLDDEPFKAEFPLNCDMNISRKCTNGCAFCYEGCTPDGNHADIKKFINDKNSFLYSLHEGTELALNGNEPLHPDLELLLQFCKERNIVANLTVQELTLLKHKDQIEEWLNKGLLHGIGVSPCIYSEDMLEFCNNHPSAVIHTIVGITTPENYKHLMIYNKLKILVLGYKSFGKGISYLYKDETVVDELTKNTNWLKSNIKDFINHFKVVSFDNLAIKQLDPKSWLSTDQWEKFYRGDDGSHTLYIDLVSETFAKNSIQRKDEHMPIMKDIKSMLKKVQGTTTEKFDLFSVPLFPVEEGDA